MIENIARFVNRVTDGMTLFEMKWANFSDFKQRKTSQKYAKHA